MLLPTVRSKNELCALVQELGFLPAFKNNVPGFSAEECIAPEYWFPPEGEGFWEWKGPVIRETGCAYGKLLKGRACFVTLPVYRELANYRRDGYDYDALCDDGKARPRDQAVFDLLWEKKSAISKELKASLNPKTFEDSIVWLQMHGYVVISNFEYAVSRSGKPYGWGLARYETPEYRFGEAFSESVYAHEPSESRSLVLTHLQKLLPTADESLLSALIG